MRRIRTKFEKSRVKFLVIGDNRTDIIEVNGSIESVNVKHNVKMVGGTKFGRSDACSPDPMIESVTEIGDIFPVLLQNGEIVDFVATEITDDYIRFDSRDCIGGIKTQWNKKGNNAGGYPGSTLWEVVNGDILNLFPDELLDRIIETKRYYLDDEKKKSYTSKLFVPVVSELFESDDCFGDENIYNQMEYYKDRRNRMKGAKKGEDTAYWWLASAYSGHSNYACYVSSYGYPSYNYVNYPYYGVPVCFRIKK